MGDASLPLVEDLGLALMQNPAGLATRHGLSGQTDIITEFTPGAASAVGSGVGSGFSLSNLSKASLDNFSALVGMGLQVFPAIAWSGLTAGVLFQERIRVTNDGTKQQSQFVNQFIPTLGYGIPLARGLLRVGYALQFVNTSIANNDADVATAPTAFSENSKVGQGVSHNASFNLIVPVRYRPTLSLAARNIFGLRYNSGTLLKRASSTSGTPENESMTVDAAFSIEPRIYGDVTSIWSIQVRDLWDAQGLNLMSKIGIGTEINFFRSLGLRAGYTANEFSFGFGFRFTDSKLDFAMYKDRDLAGIGPEFNTRYMIQYSFSFGGHR